MRLLIVEDDPILAPSLKDRLEEQGHAVDVATTGEDGLDFAPLAPYDLLILDIMLPKMDGLTLCRRLRERGYATPILLLTSLGEIEQRIAGLDAGADDYLCKPFDVGELLARVRALLRRLEPVKSPILRFLDIALDTRTHEVWRGDRALSLTAKEYALLEFLLRHPRQVLSRKALVDHVWDFDAAHLSNVLEVFVANLRRKLCAAGEVDVIRTIRGAGYQVREPAQ